MKPNATALARPIGSGPSVVPAPVLVPPPDPALDREIIDAFIDEESGALRALYGRGLTEKAVNDRAGKLGLTREFIKRCRLAGTRPAMRACVKCDAPFLSAGKHNRLCGRCPAR